MTSPYDDLDDDANDDFAESDFGIRPWQEIEPSLLEGGRIEPPNFPIRFLPRAWRHWVVETAEAAGTAIDYVAQGLLASVAALSGAGVRVQVSPTWSEPLVLWLALVGSPSSGKSPALAALREPLGRIEQAMREIDAMHRTDEDGEDGGDGKPVVPRQLIVADATMEALADVVAGNPRGVILWRDELTAWLANLGRYASGGSDRAHWLEAWSAASVTVNRRSRNEPLYLRRFPVSIVGSIQPGRLSEALAGSDDGMAARFLYSWPNVPPYMSLLKRRVPDHASALAMLVAISRIVGTASEPLRLSFSEKATESLDRAGEIMHMIGRHIDGLEAGWVGKGGGTVARLAGALTLLDWSQESSAAAPATIGHETVANAEELWMNYFFPHARRVFADGKSDPERHARKVVQWLKTQSVRQVSREDLRRRALARALTADQTDMLIQRLAKANLLRPARSEWTGSGRPALRWDVNPALFAGEEE
ncbi:MAG TPA: DUF3987 domain-containing protein [Reyranella sp.]|nr:DUF3987 domain-containing protein [Reyranella sp.]